MVWIYVALGVAVLGLVLLGWYVFRLYRKVAVLLTEVGVLADQAGQVLDLLAQIEIPDQLGGRYDAAFPNSPTDVD